MLNPAVLGDGHPVGHHIQPVPAAEHAAHLFGLRQKERSLPQVLHIPAVSLHRIPPKGERPRKIGKAADLQLVL